MGEGTACVHRGGVWQKSRKSLSTEVRFDDLRKEKEKKGGKRKGKERKDGKLKPKEVKELTQGHTAGRAGT